MSDSKPHCGQTTPSCGGCWKSTSGQGSRPSIQSAAVRSVQARRLHTARTPARMRYRRCPGQRARHRITLQASSGRPRDRHQPVHRDGTRRPASARPHEIIMTRGLDSVPAACTIAAGQLAAISARRADVGSLRTYPLILRLATASAQVTASLQTLGGTASHGRLGPRCLSDEQINQRARRRGDTGGGRAWRNGDARSPSGEGRRRSSGNPAPGVRARPHRGGHE